MSPEVAVVLVAGITVVPATITAVGVWRTNRVVKDTHDQVVTLNESTIGQLAASAETRRVENITHDDRTMQEQRHVDTAPEPGPPQGPPR